MTNPTINTMPAHMDYDMELVSKIAHHELAMLADKDMTDFDDCEMSQMVAERFLETYLSAPNLFVKPNLNHILETTTAGYYVIGEDGQETYQEIPLEFRIGYMLAVGARLHACRILDDAAFNFVRGADMTMNNVAPCDDDLAAFKLTDARLRGED